MIIKISSSDVPFSRDIQNFCKNKYPGHPAGCPNYGKKKGCPPDAKLVNEIIDFNKDIYLIYTDFAIGEWAKKMRERHLEWSERQCYNPRLWQGRARKEHRLEIEKAMKELKLDKVVLAPEKNGVNVNLVMTRIGARLQWPPKNISRIVSLGGFRI